MEFIIGDTTMYNNCRHIMKDSVKTFLSIALVFFALMLTALTIKAQDTTCVMITLDEVITFNYQTSKIIEREPIEGITTLRVESGEVLCLHLRDKKKRYRDITTTWDDGDHRHDTFLSKDDVYFTPYGFGAMWVEIGRPKRRKSTKE
jgi:hypothetical protein